VTITDELVDRCARALVRWNNEHMIAAIGRGPGTNLDFDRMDEYPKRCYREKARAVLEEAAVAASE
jgi:hypothetical protein